MKEIVEAGTKEIPIIHTLAHQIWPHTFSDILSPQQITYMLEWMYSRKALQKQMKEGHHFLLLKTAKTYCGYCSYQQHQQTLKLHKIYILPQKQGQGLGAYLFKEVETAARENGISKLLLNVNRYNKAISFYRKKGFRVIREEDNSIGQGYFMNDYVMEKQL